MVTVPENSTPDNHDRDFILYPCKPFEVTLTFSISLSNLKSPIFTDPTDAAVVF